MQYTMGSILSFFSRTRATQGPKPGVDYLTIRDTFRPLDLLFFNAGDLIADSIRWLQRRNLRPGAGRFSHVGLVVTSEILDDPRLEEGKLYVWESTMSGRLTGGVLDIDGHEFLGVQLRALDDVLVAYDRPHDACVAIARLDTKHRAELESHGMDLVQERFTSIFRRYNGTPYETNPISLVSSILRWLRCVRDNGDDGPNTHLFCSELAARCYCDLGIFDATRVRPENVVPEDFLGLDTDTESDGGVPHVVDEPIVFTLYGSSSASSTSLNDAQGKQ